jgi:hypothetical protein
VTLPSLPVTYDHGMRTLIVACALVVPAVAGAQSWEQTKETARAAAKTAVDATVAAGRTIAATGEAFWHAGKPAATRAYHENAGRARREVGRDADQTRAAAHRR